MSDLLDFLIVGGDTNVPSNTVVLDSLTNSRYNTGSSIPGPNQFTMNAQNNSELTAVGEQVAGSLCTLPFVCACPAGYTIVYLDDTTETYSASTGVFLPKALTISSAVTSLLTTSHP